MTEAAMEASVVMVVVEPVTFMVMMTQLSKSLLHPCQGSSIADRTGTGVLASRESADFS